MEIIPVILAGGSGVRLWPLSRQNYAKQLLNLTGHATLLHNTMCSVQYIPQIMPPLIVGLKEQRFILAEQVRQLAEEATLLLEPASRNTAPAATVATLYAMLDSADPLLLLLPSDHVISDLKKFAEMIEQTMPLAIQGKLVSFGVIPSFPETGYGYIQKGEFLPHAGAYMVEAFSEKPTAELAEFYVASKNYYWNSGIFFFKASAFIREVERWAPEVLDPCRQAIRHLHKCHDYSYLEDTFLQACPTISIDKAVFEKTDQAVVFPFSCDWRDLGDWNSLYDMGEKDLNGNVIHGNIVTFDTQNCYLNSNHSLVVTAGVSDCLVVATQDAVLVAKLSSRPDIKLIVAFLIEKKRVEAINYPIVYRHWGHYEVTEKSKGYEIKHFYMNPQAEWVANPKYHYCTYWLVVAGRGLFEVQNNKKTVDINDSFMIACGEEFCLKNTSSAQLHLIQIQSRTG